LHNESTLPEEKLELNKNKVTGIAKKIAACVLVAAVGSAGLVYAGYAKVKYPIVFNLDFGCDSTKYSEELKKALAKYNTARKDYFLISKINNNYEISLFIFTKYEIINSKVVVNEFKSILKILETETIQSGVYEGSEEKFKELVKFMKNANETRKARKIAPPSLDHKPDNAETIKNQESVKAALKILKNISDPYCIFVDSASKGDINKLSEETQAVIAECEKNKKEYVIISPINENETAVWNSAQIKENKEIYILEKGKYIFNKKQFDFKAYLKFSGELKPCVIYSYSEEKHSIFAKIYALGTRKSINEKDITIKENTENQETYLNSILSDITSDKAKSQTKFPVIFDFVSKGNINKLSEETKKIIQQCYVLRKKFTIISNTDENICKVWFCKIENVNAKNICKIFVKTFCFEYTEQNMLVNLVAYIKDALMFDSSGPVIISKDFQNRENLKFKVNLLSDTEYRSLVYCKKSRSLKKDAPAEEQTAFEKIMRITK
jgi:hypothetical protein